MLRPVSRRDAWIKGTTPESLRGVILVPLLDWATPGTAGMGLRLKKWPFARHGRSGRLSRLGSGRPPSRSDPTTKLGDNLPPGASSICESLPRRHSDAEAVVLVLPRWLTEGASQHSDA